jgi:tRNA(Ile2) C34 agmatinyltransferase TiaS
MDNNHIRILVSIDDTDNLESRGTGHLAAILSDEIESRGWGQCRPVTRHQMLVDPRIPYTSHNSVMCFPARIEPTFLAPLTQFAQEFLERESAEGSDPGLCIINTETLKDRDALMEFGRRAKQTVLTKDEAYSLARYLCVHLSEHGGTGMGVIGALAGCGLRLTGNDGRYRGHYQVDTETDHLTAGELMRQTGVDVVKSLDGLILEKEEAVRIGEKVKAVRQDGKKILLVFAGSTGQTGRSSWQTCTKEQLKVF